MKLVFTLFAVIFIALVSFLFSAIFIAENKNIEIGKLIDEQIAQINLKINQTFWFSKLASKKHNDFFPISNELYLHFELEDMTRLNKKKFYELKINKNDKYSIFCIKQAIKELDLKYFLINNEEKSQIIVDTSNLSLLHFLTEKLKKYDIATNFNEIWI